MLIKIKLRGGRSIHYHWERERIDSIYVYGI